MGYAMYIAGLNEDDGYFCANISGMPVLRNEMRRYGMLNDVVDSHDAPERDRDNWGYPETSWEPTPVTGIPTFKLSYNDGELVTPGEIRKALAEYDSRPHRDYPELLQMSQADAEYGRLEALRAALWPLALQSVPFAAGWMPSDADSDPDLEAVTGQRQRAESQEMWRRWIVYLRLAALHDGFYVY